MGCDRKCPLIFSGHLLRVAKRLCKASSIWNSISREVGTLRRTPGTARLCRTSLLLPGHGHVQPLLGTDEVIVGILTQVDPHPVDRAGEHAGLQGIIVRHRCPGISPHVDRLVSREDERDRAFNAPGSDLLAIVVE